MAASATLRPLLAAGAVALLVLLPVASCGAQGGFPGYIAPSEPVAPTPDEPVRGALPDSVRGALPDSVFASLDALFGGLAGGEGFGGAVLMARGGEVVYEGAWGWANREENVPFTPDTPMESASVTKTFTAATVWLLVEEGHLGLDDPVIRYLSDYPHGETTLRHLLSHSAGLPDYGHFDALFHQVVTTHGMLAYLAGTEPAFPPGSAFRYCNVCFDALAAVVEQVAGDSWEAFLRDRLLEPLGMTSAFVRPARLADFPSGRTMGYRSTPDGPRLHDLLDNEGFYGGSNLHLSARDLLRWSEAWRNGEVLNPGPPARGSLTASVGSPPVPTGLTLHHWYRQGAGQEHYRGHHQGFGALVWRDGIRGNSVVLISNGGLPAGLLPGVERALLAAVEGKDFALPMDPGWLPLVASPGGGEAPPEPGLGPEALEGTWTAGAEERWIPWTGGGAMRLRDPEAESAPGAFLQVRVESGAEYDAFLATPSVLYVPGLDLWMGAVMEGGTVRLEVSTLSGVWRGVRREEVGGSGPWYRSPGSP